MVSAYSGWVGVGVNERISFAGRTRVAQKVSLKGWLCYNIVSTHGRGIWICHLDVIATRDLRANYIETPEGDTA